MSSDVTEKKTAFPAAPDKVVAVVAIGAVVEREAAEGLSPNKPIQPSPALTPPGSSLPARPESAPKPDPAPEPEPARVLLHMPVDIRSMSLVMLAILAGVFVLHWAKAVFVPVMLGLMVSYALSPVVNGLERRRVPRALSAAVLLLAILGGLGFTAWSLSDDAVELVETLPSAAQKLARVMQAKSSGTPSTLDTVQKAAAQVEQAARGDAAPAPVRGVTRVMIESKPFNIKDYLVSGSLGLLAALAQAIVVVFLAFFLMISGDTFRRKMLKLAGDDFSSKKITLQALHEVTDQIQRYLQVQILTSAIVGVLTWGALAAIGLENALVWGIVAGVLNFIPYLGTVITAGASAMVGFLQFGTLDMALLVGGVSLAIHALTGNLLTPWLTSKTSRLSPVAVFVGMLAWGWLWGVWGLLLGIPILMMAKAVCDRVEDLKPIGEFLGS